MDTISRVKAPVESPPSTCTFLYTVLAFGPALIGGSAGGAWLAASCAVSFAGL